MEIIKKIKKFFGIMSDADKQRVELRRVSQVFGTLERMQRCGLLDWVEKDRRLFIAEPLARVQLRSRETWDAFMQNVMMWNIYKRQNEAWQKAFTLAESKAIREARKKYAILTKAEIESIRSAARDKVQEDAVNMPKVEGFEIFIISPTSLSPALQASPQPSPVGREKMEGEANAEKGSSILAVGKYDAETERTDMVMWEEIQTHLPTSSR